MKVLIVGNNVSGTTAARRIRELSADTEISVLSSEPHPYYTRPKLIDLIAGQCSESDLFFYKPEWYVKNRIDVLTSTTVLSIDTEKRRVVSSAGEHSYDKLIIATGAESFIPPVCKSSLGRVFTLRKIDDALAISAAAKISKKAVIIGGGVLGLEIAHAVKSVNPDLEVVVLEVFDRLLPRQLDAEGSMILNGILSAGKIASRTCAKISGLEGSGNVSAVILEKEKIEADMVCISAGVRPNLSLFEGTGITVNKGVLVNNQLQTSDPDIYAIGDCAEHNNTVYGIIKPALEMASILAANIVFGKREMEYKGSLVSKTFKVLGTYLTSMGISDPEETDSYDTIRASTESEYRKYVLSKADGRLAGYMAIAKRPQENKVLKALLSGTDFSVFKDRMHDVAFEF